MNLIEIEKASKQFKKSLFVSPSIVLEEINLIVQEGDFVILKGENGSGKTTLLNLILGLIKPSSGQIKLMGLSPTISDSKSSVGCVLQNTEIPSNIKVKELIQLWHSYYPNPLTVDEVLKRVSLEDQAESWATDLSGGQKQRLYFGLALVGNPKLLILDEPTRNLDDDSYEAFWEQIQLCRQEEKTILMVTNNQTDQEKLKNFKTRIVTLQKYSKITNNHQLVDYSEIKSQSSDKPQEYTPVSFLNIFLKQIWFEGLQVLRTPSFLIGILFMSIFIPFLFKLFSSFTEAPKVKTILQNRLFDLISSKFDLAIINNPLPQLTSLCGLLLFIIVIEKLAKRITVERSEKWLKLMKASPLPPWVYITAKLFTITLICLVFSITYFGLATFLLNLESSLVLFIKIISALTIGMILLPY